MSRLIIHHSLEAIPPAELGPIWFEDWTIVIDMIWFEGDKKHKGIKVTMAARFYGEADDEMKRRLLMSSHCSPEIHFFQGEETPLTEVKMPDPKGLMAWLGLRPDPATFEYSQLQQNTEA